jgi:hypothetical protein
LNRYLWHNHNLETSVPFSYKRPLLVEINILKNRI